MKKVRFMKKFIGGCIAAMILAVAAVDAVPRIPGDRLGTDCSVCCDDDIRNDAPQPKPTTPQE